MPPISKSAGGFGGLFGAYKDVLAIYLSASKHNLQDVDWQCQHHLLCFSNLKQK